MSTGRSEIRRYGRPDVYAAADKMESTLFDGLTIDLAAVFAE